MQAPIRFSTPRPPADDTQEPSRLPIETGPTFGQQQLLALGMRIRELRKSRMWSLKRLGEESGVSVAAIQKIESGATNTSLLTVMLLSEALGERVDRLVRRSQLATQSRKLVHVAIPRHPARGIELSDGMAEARLRGQMVVVQAGVTVVRSPAPDGSPSFAFVISGKLDVAFGDGATQALEAGDAMHLSMPEHMTWTNPHDGDAHVLCVFDSRGRQETTNFGAVT